ARVRLSTFILRMQPRVIIVSEGVYEDNRIFTEAFFHHFVSSGHDYYSLRVKEVWRAEDEPNFVIDPARTFLFDVLPRFATFVLEKTFIVDADCLIDLILTRLSLGEPG
ncbi:hypothetical protein PFISCL1PPCAC_18216, partial [Pristionchus fissidentatus]